ncbi:TadE/TadG family type IV pilus assembly protein [Sphingomonas glaciei]|uniref:Pilus assembly protein n=1 Tax=Sphingomonas glaciei TaxID=2938948 RepID=A0ABY5MW19_9SPHN|nr:TadE/TadG family type IV pilus assembly protein [Sphingomonas glaciei]UUR08317.1 pilus assembly protein [Sphingomonas glaciei]
MTGLRAIVRCERGAAGAEMALVLPLLLVLMVSAFELGNYFREWHTLSKGVRDGARFAARHDFADFDCGTATAADNVVTATEEVVRTGVASGTADLLPNWDSAEVVLSVECSSSVITGVDGDGEDINEELAGIYRGAEDGAPVVTLTVRLPYRGLFGQFGWNGSGLNIAASEQAAVMGV